MQVLFNQSETVMTCFARLHDMQELLGDVRSLFALPPTHCWPASQFQDATVEIDMLSNLLPGEDARELRAVLAASRRPLSVHEAARMLDHFHRTRDPDADSYLLNRAQQGSRRDFRAFLTVLRRLLVVCSPSSRRLLVVCSSSTRRMFRRSSPDRQRDAAGNRRCRAAPNGRAGSRARPVRAKSVPSARDRVFLLSRESHSVALFFGQAFNSDENRALFRSLLRPERWQNERDKRAEEFGVVLLPPSPSRVDLGFD